MLYLLIAFGCALGGVCRYLCMTVAERCLGDAFPWGTLIVNAVGSFLLGGILGAGLIPGGGGSATEQLNAFAAIGFCGGLTTFSTFSLQNLTLASQRAKVKLLVNVFGSVGLCLLMVVVGYTILERWVA